MCQWIWARPSPCLPSCRQNPKETFLSKENVPRHFLSYSRILYFPWYFVFGTSNNPWKQIKCVSRVFALFASPDNFRGALTSLNWGHKSSYNQNTPASTKASNFFIIAMSNKFFPLISFSLPPTVFNLFRHNGKRYDVPHAISTPLSPYVKLLPLTVGLSNKDRIVKNWQGEILCEQKNMVRNNFVLNCPIFPKML